MKIRDKNPQLAGLISRLEERGREEKAPFWSALAKKLNRPRRQGHEVNLFSLDRNAPAKSTVVVPGTVLGTGAITKPVTVAALRFSRGAEEKISKAGGRCMSIESFMQEKKSGKGVLILG